MGSEEETLGGSRYASSVQRSDSPPAEKRPTLVREDGSRGEKKSKNKDKESHGNISWCRVDQEP